MTERLPMNSESLQKQFPEIYANFFIANDIVVSACYSIPWGGAVIGHRSKYLRTLVKIPLRCYVGIKKRSDQNIIFKDVISFNITNHIFETSPYTKTNPEHEKIKTEIQSYLEKEKFIGGVEISILSETTRGHGLGFSALSSTGIALALSIFQNKIHPQNLKNFSQLPIFQEIFQTAWRWEFISRYGNTIGEAIHLALSPDTISFHYCDQFDKETIPEQLVQITSKAQHLVHKDTSSIKSSELPIDFCLIYSGHPTNTRIVESFREADKNNLDNSIQTLQNSIFHEEKLKNIYVKSCFQKKSPYDIIQEALITLNIRTVEAFIQISQRGFDQSIAHDLIENTNQYRHVLSIAERQDSFANELAFQFNLQKKSASEAIGIVPCYTGKSGGGYLVVLRSGVDRKFFENMIPVLKNHYPDIALEYASWLDGDSCEGPIIEHYPRENIQSKLIPTDCAVFRDNLGNTYLANHLEILDREKDGLLLDAVEMKISVNGHRPTSKDIPSQSIAIEVLSRLIHKTPGDIILNSALPASSYAKDKGLLLSKALAPLANYVKQITKKDLPITCHGSSGSFSISLGKTDLRIGLVTR